MCYHCLILSMLSPPAECLHLWFVRWEGHISRFLHENDKCPLNFFLLAFIVFPTGHAQCSTNYPVGFSLAVQTCISNSPSIKRHAGGSRQLLQDSALLLFVSELHQPDDPTLGCCHFIFRPSASKIPASFFFCSAASKPSSYDCHVIIDSKM